MSYAPSAAGSLGFLEWIILGAALGPAGGTEGCAGGILSAEGDHCCPEDSWNNDTYAIIKGQESLRYHNEKRVRRALELMSPDALAHAEWLAEGEIGAPVTTDQRFLAAIPRAQANFLATNPPERWWREDGAIGNDCAENGYNRWRQNPVPETAAYHNALSEMLRGMTIEQWDALRNAVVASVPGGEPGSLRTAFPATGELYHVEGTRIVPSAWTKSFLDVFAPGWDQRAIVNRALSQDVLNRKLSLTLLAPERATSLRSAIRQVSSTRTQAVADDDTGAVPAAASAPSKLTLPLVVGGIAVAGVGAYLLLRR